MTTLAPTGFPRFADLLASEPEAELFARLRAARRALAGRSGTMAFSADLSE